MEGADAKRIAPGFLDTREPMGMTSFELDRQSVAGRVVTRPGVAEHLDVVEYIGPGFVARVGGATNGRASRGPWQNWWPQLTLLEACDGKVACANPQMLLPTPS